MIQMQFTSQFRLLGLLGKIEYFKKRDINKTIMMTYIVTSDMSNTITLERLSGVLIEYVESHNSLEPLILEDVLVYLYSWIEENTLPRHTKFLNDRYFGYIVALAVAPLTAKGIIIQRKP